jgi:ChrR Cupin-like domain
MSESRSDELADVGKAEMEFFDTQTVPWTPVTWRPGVSERVLARDPDRGLLTRIVRWEPGLDTSSAGPVAHDYFEEVLILSGSMHDLVLQQTFSAGFYACRPPRMVHGPWTTAEGCIMLEIQYAGDQA